MDGLFFRNTLNSKLMMMMMLLLFAVSTGQYNDLSLANDGLKGFRRSETMEEAGVRPSVMVDVAVFESSLLADPS